MTASPKISRARVPSCSFTGSAPSRIVPPMSETSFCSGSRSTTGNGRLGVELGGVGAVHAGHVAGELDHRDLHPEADPQVGDLALAGDPRRLDLALDAALAEAAGDQDPVAALELLGVEVLGVDQLDLDVDAVVEAAVLERLDHRLVGVGELHVLADDGDPHLAARPSRRGAPSPPTRSGPATAPPSRSGRARGRRRPRRGRRAAPCRCCRRRGRRSRRRREGWRRGRSCCGSRGRAALRSGRPARAAGSRSGAAR